MEKLQNMIEEKQDEIIELARKQNKLPNTPDFMNGNISLKLQGGPPQNQATY